MDRNAWINSKSDSWLKMWRSTLNNPVVMKDSDYFTIWHILLYLAAYAPTKAMFNGKSVTLQPGQLIIGRKVLSELVNNHISPSKVQRILKSLESEQQIEQQTTPRSRLITIVNWKKYQSSEQQSEQQVNNNWTTSEQQLNTKEEYIEYKNKRKRAPANAEKGKIEVEKEMLRRLSK